VDYDSEADALYIRLTDERFARSAEFGLNVIVDLDAEGRPCGVEVISPGYPSARELARAAARFRMDAEALTAAVVASVAAADRTVTLRVSQSRDPVP
jgi:hypothetical protein